MAHSFKNYPAKPAFGVNRESYNASEYILRKKSKAAFCSYVICPQRYTLNTQGEIRFIKTLKIY